MVLVKMKKLAGFEKYVHFAEKCLFGFLEVVQILLGPTLRFSI